MTFRKPCAPSSSPPPARDEAHPALPLPCESELVAEVLAICRGMLDEQDGDRITTTECVDLLPTRDRRDDRPSAPAFGEGGRNHLRQREWRLAHDAFVAELTELPLRDTDRATLLFGLGQARSFLGDHRSAVNTLREALDFEAANLEILSRLIFTLELLGQTADAAQAWLCIGIVLEGRRRIPEAINAYQQVLAGQPACLDARIRLGALQLLVGEPNQAVCHLEAAIEIAPDHAAAHVAFGRAKHLTGKTDEGWEEFAWFSPKERVKTWRAFEQPMWDGSSLVGKRILLWTPHDLDLGDTLQFVRWARLLKARGAERVIVECEQQLIALVAPMPDVDRAVVRSAPLPPFDVHIPMMQVAVLDRQAREPSAADVPYLSVVPAHIAAYKAQLGTFDGMSVGLCWGSHSNRSEDRLRSAPLSAFTPLGRLTDVRLASLQLGSHGDQAFVSPAGLDVRRLLASSASLVHTAALMHALDLIITVDTVTAHLAGALGRPVWTLLPYGGDWRWGTSDTTSWYPTMRLFRQRGLDDWDEVLERVSCELDRLCASQRVSNRS